MSNQATVIFNVQTGDAIAQANALSTSFQGVGTSATQTSVSMRSLATSFVGLTAGAVGLAVSYTQIERASLNLEKAHLRQITLQDQINKLHKEGKDSTQEYAKAVAELAIVNDQINVQQDRLNDSYLLFGTSILQTATSAVFAVSTAINALRGASVAATAARATQGTTEVAVAAETTASAIATDAGTLSLRGLTAAAWAFVATPLGAVLLAVGAAFAVWETNLGNLRGTVEKMTGLHLSLTDAITGLFHTTQDQAGPALDTYAKTMDDVSTKTDKAKTSTDKLTQSMKDLKEQAKEVAAIGDELKKKREENAASFIATVQGISNQTGVPVDQIAAAMYPSLVLADAGSIWGGGVSIGGNAPALATALTAGLTNFGQKMMNSGLFSSSVMLNAGAQPSPYGVGYGSSGPNGVNTSTLGRSGTAQDVAMTNITAMYILFPESGTTYLNEDQANALNTMLINNVDFYRSILSALQDDPEYSAFIAMRTYGWMPTGVYDSYQGYLDEAMAAYNQLVAPIRPDLLAQLNAPRTLVVGDARRTRTVVSIPQYNLPTMAGPTVYNPRFGYQSIGIAIDQERLNMMIADSLYPSESAWQAEAGTASQYLGLTPQQVADVMAPDKTRNDINAEIDYQRTLQMVSS